MNTLNEMNSLNMLNNTMTYRYSLEPYHGPASRYTCPQCSGKRKFTRYLDNATGEQLPNHVGKCDRQDNCGYHFSPHQYFRDERLVPEDRNWQKPTHPAIALPVEYLPDSVCEASMARLTLCDLFPYLESLFTRQEAEKLCQRYLVGSSKENRTTFWQADHLVRIRQAKLMRYLPNGHRDKHTAPLYVGKLILGNPEANLQHCFFGEHLINHPGNLTKPVAIVESEKTALICSMYYPEYVWLATGGKSGLKWTEAKVCEVLNGRNVVLFPDLGAFNVWSGKGLMIAATAGCKVATSDFLEKVATEDEKKQGLDLADYLVRHRHHTGLALTDDDYPVIWDYSDRWPAGKTTESDTENRMLEEQGFAL